MKLSPGRKTQYLTKRKKKNGKIAQQSVIKTGQNQITTDLTRSFIRLHGRTVKRGKKREVLGKKKKPMPQNKTIPQELIMEHKIA